MKHEDTPRDARKGLAGILNRLRMTLSSVTIPAESLADVKDRVRKIVMRDPDVVAMRDFYFNSKQKIISLKMVISADSVQRMELYHATVEELQEAWPDYAILIQQNIDQDEKMNNE